MNYYQYTHRLSGLYRAFNKLQKDFPPQTDTERRGRREDYHKDVMKLRQEYERSVKRQRRGTVKIKKARA